MGKTKLTSTVIAIVLAASGTAWGGPFVDGAKLNQWCLSDIQLDMLACHGYVSATYDRWWAHGRYSDGTLSCPPEDLTSQTLQETVSAFLRQYPETADYPSATIMVLGATIDAWPCGFPAITGRMINFPVYSSRCTGVFDLYDAWCEGFVTGSIDGAIAMYEAGNPNMSDINAAALNMTVDQALDLVRRHLLRPDSPYGWDSMPFAQIDAAIEEYGTTD